MRPTDIKDSIVRHVKYFRSVSLLSHHFPPLTYHRSQRRSHRIPRRRVPSPAILLSPRAHPPQELLKIHPSRPQRTLEGKSDERLITFPTDDPDVFALYVGYLYIGKIAPELTHLEPRPGDNNAEGNVADTEDDSDVEATKPKIWGGAIVELLCDLYILGDKLMDVAFRNTVLDALVEFYNA
ncbi:uncharacterized protein BDZ99DRAFT_472212 [Mytilinidion resinicola]|uniref:BTB domain-containing protein n=1 Tax=Mytilinidion resinicola TaxID=574789 RepID=A0A6A6Z1H1_9PEZI|nr:uncharacterized protein BDZ99DRAFT_472212 [Mytilinidion resinicola]KAF2814840.1 hypothetical protein BDZ99DRAFT_472212 [Mytilinidion resinicola]